MTQTVLFLKNDSVNTFNEVTESLKIVLPRCSARLATDLCLEAHNHGQAVVFIGDAEQAESVKQKLGDCQLTIEMRSYDEADPEFHRLVHEYSEFLNRRFSWSPGIAALIALITVAVFLALHRH